MANGVTRNILSENAKNNGSKSDLERCMENANEEAARLQGSKAPKSANKKK